MKITDKIYKIIALLVIAGIAIPFVTALGATVEPEVGAAQNIDSKSSILPNVVVTEVVTTRSVNIVNFTRSECSLQVELSEQPAVQGQKGINLYQPADCYQITVASAPRHSTLDIATTGTYATLAVEARASQNITTSHLTVGQDPFSVAMYIPGNNISLEYKQSKNLVNSEPSQIVNYKLDNLSQRYAYRELQIFRC